MGSCPDTGKIGSQWLTVPCPPRSFQRVVVDRQDVPEHVRVVVGWLLDEDFGKSAGGDVHLIPAPAKKRAPTHWRNRFICDGSGAFSAITLTIGLPALAITNDSPLAACSIGQTRRRVHLLRPR